jgi:tetratricopeptide (TPR) repeat protein
MHTATPSSDTARLDRLEAYLQHDPQNLVLLGDAFDTALRAGLFDRAVFHLRHAQALGADPRAWTLREAHWLMAQRRLEPARELLAGLLAQAASSPGLAVAIAHDLAVVALKQGDPEGGLNALRKAVETERPELPLAPVTQALWLRLLHGSGRLDEAMGWAAAREQRGGLGAEAAGVASLAALDAGDFTACRAWAERALGEGGTCVEALVARGSLALADRQSELARRLLSQALVQLPGDGRTLSALAFCELLDQHPDIARGWFDRAVVAMPRHIGTWHGLAWTALMLGDLPAARRAFETALGLDRNLGESHGGLAVVQALGQESAAARSSIERALRLDPASLAARYAQAVIDGEAKDPQVLQRLAQRVLGARLATAAGRHDGATGTPEGAADGTADSAAP